MAKKRIANKHILFHGKEPSWLGKLVSNKSYPSELSSDISSDISRKRDPQRARIIRVWR